MKSLYLSIFICLSVGVSYAQEPRYERDESVIDHIESHLIKLDFLLFQDKTTILQPDTLQPSNIDNSNDYIINSLISKQKRAYNSKTGLSLQTLYNNQQGVAVVDYSDEENIYPHRNKFQVSLNWNILESSIIGRKTSHKTFEIEGQQSLHHLNKEIQSISKEQLLLDIEERWDAKILYINHQRLLLLSKILNLKEHLFSSRRVFYSDVASVHKEIFKVRAFMPNIGYEIELDSFKLMNLDHYVSELALDTVGIFNTYMDNNIDLKQFPLEQQLFVLNKQSLSYLKQMKIGVFSKFQYFGGAIGSEYNGRVDLGLSATFPLSREHKKKRDVINTEIEMSKREQLHAEQSIMIHYKSQVKELSIVTNRLMQEIYSLTPIARNIINYRDKYQHNISSFETLLFEYDAYLVSLATIYLTIKEREILIESLIN